MEPRADRAEPARVAEAEKAFVYDAFLSYSHRVDRDLARVFQSDIERFGARFPWSRPRRIYRDETNLSATPDLWSTIERALDGSGRLILLASPESARSVWVPRELAYFATKNGIAAACVVLTRGKTRYTDPGDLDDEERALADTTVAHFGAAEPLLIDLRPFRDAPRRARSSHDYLNAVATVVAFVTGRDKDSLFSEHIARRHWWTRVLAAITVAIAALAVVAVLQTRAARRQQLRAERLRAVTEIELQATRARLDVSEQPEKALLEAAGAWRAARSFVPGPADAEIDALAHRTRVTAASALSSTLQAHAGLIGHLDGARRAVRGLSVDKGVVTAVDAGGRVLQWDLDSRVQRLAVTLPGAADIASNRASVTDGVVAAEVSGHVVLWIDGAITSLAVDPDGPIAIGRRGDLLAFRRLSGLFLIDRSAGDAAIRLGPVTQSWDDDAIAFSPAGDRLYVAGAVELAQIQVWDVASRQLLRTTFRTPGGSTTHIAVSDDGELVAATTLPGQLIVWDRHGTEVRRWPLPGLASAVAFMPGEVRHAATAVLCTTDDHGSLTSWMVGRNEPFSVSYAHRGGATAIAVGGGAVLTGGEDGSVRLWSGRNDPLTDHINEGDRNAIRFTERGMTSLRRPSKYWTAALLRWKVAPGPPTVTPLLGDMFQATVIGADDVLVGISTEAERDRTLTALFPDTGERIQLADKTPPNAAVAISSQGRVVIVWARADSGKRWAWDLASPGRKLVDLTPDTTVQALAFNRTGTHLIAALKGQELALWTTSPLRSIARKALPWQEVAAVALDDDIQHVALGGYHGDVEIRALADSAKTGLLIHAFKNRVCGFAFHPVESWLAAVDDFGNGAIFDTRTGDPIVTFKAVGADLANTRDLEFEASGKRLLIKGGSWPELVSTDPNDWAAMAEHIGGLPQRRADTQR